MRRILTSSLDQVTLQESVLERLEEVDIELLKENVVAQLKDESEIERQRSALCLQHHEMMATDAVLTGGKGSSLAILQTVRHVEVPPFFCVTTRAFQEHFAKAGLGTEVAALQAATDAGQGSDSLEVSEIVYQRAERLRELVERASLAEDVAVAVRAAYRALCEECGAGNKGVAVSVRSSATTEDQKDASFAGQHATFLNVVGVDSMLDAVRKCWASLYTDRACVYRGNAQVPHRDAIMALVVQVMVEPAAAGTAFSVELSTNSPAVHISANYGLGESVVNGSVTCDDWLADPAQDLRLIRRTLGSKETEIVGTGKPGGGTLTKPVERARRETYCLSNADVNRVAEGTARIQRVYATLYQIANVDTEFAVTGAGDVRFLQSRPVVVVNSTDVLTVDRHAVSVKDVVCRASYSLLGAVTGRIKIVNDIEELESGSKIIEAEDILVCPKTSNVFEKFLSKLKCGIVTMDGSPSAHPMLIGRERGLVVLCGIPNLWDAVRYMDGKMATLDGLSKTLYRGAVHLKSATQEELEAAFVPQKPVPTQTDRTCIEFLDKYGRLERVADGNGPERLWVKNPNTSLPPAWCELYGRIYEARFHVVNRARSSPLQADPLSCTHRVLHGQYNADEYVPVARTLSVFDGMSVPDFQRYFAMVDKDAVMYLRACEDFGHRPSVSTWRAYCEAYVPLYAALWLSFFVRMRLKTMSSTLAHDLGISNFHYSAMLQYQQTRNHAREEEFELHSEIASLAAAIHPFALSAGESYQLSQDGCLGTLSVKTIVSVALMKDAFRHRLESIAQRFRIGKRTGIHEDMPVEVVVELVLSSIMQGAVTPAADRTERIDYFPQIPEVMQTIAAHMESRIQNSNAHHYKVRGQWHVRHGLEAVARGVGIRVEDLFEAGSVAEVESVIRRFEQASIQSRSSAGSDATRCAPPAPTPYLTVSAALLAGIVIGVFLAKKKVL